MHWIEFIKTPCYHGVLKFCDCGELMFDQYYDQYRWLVCLNCFPQPFLKLMVLFCFVLLLLFLLSASHMMRRLHVCSESKQKHLLLGTTFSCGNTLISIQINIDFGLFMWFVDSYSLFHCVCVRYWFCT